VTSWTVVHQVPLFTAFFRQEYWTELLFPPPGDLPHPYQVPPNTKLKKTKAALIRSQPHSQSWAVILLSDILPTSSRLL